MDRKERRRSSLDMARGGADTVRPFPAAGGGDEVSAAWAATTGFPLAETDWPADPMVWGDEKRMKRELVAWAKAVAYSMAATSKNASRRRRRP